MLIAFVTHRTLPQLADDDRLAAAELRQDGIDVESAVWDSPLIDWTRYDALILRSVSDRVARAAEFEAWLAHVERAGVTLWNPGPLVRWNMDPQYLHDLAERGVATRGAHPGGADASDSWSFVFFGGRYSHAVRTPTDGAPAVRTAAGESEGVAAPRAIPRAALVAQAITITDQLPAEWLYARVDAIEVDRALQLTALDLIEPCLHLGAHPTAARRFAMAVRHALVGRRVGAWTPRSVTPRSNEPGPG